MCDGVVEKKNVNVNVIAFLLMSLFMNEQAAVAKVEATLHKRVRGTGIVGTGKQVAPI